MTQIPSSHELLLPALVALGTAAGATWLALRLARRWRIVDTPNQRSSHTAPTPTLGGLGIVAGIWAGLAVSVASRPELMHEAGWGAMAVGSAILLVAVVDELGRPLRVWEKLLIQLGAALAWVVLGPALTTVDVPLVGALELGPGLGALVAGLWIVGLMNVFNFMDGIDGITAVESIGVTGAAAIAMALVGGPLPLLPIVLAASCMGFLIFNVPPARIFMGDVGSMSLGFLIAATGILGEQAGLPMWMLATLLLCYLFDSAYTLMRRLVRGENVLRAHKQHLYQRLVQRGWSHGSVDIALLLLNAVLAVGVCLLQATYATAGVACVAAVVICMIAAAIWLERTEGFRD